MQLKLNVAAMTVAEMSGVLALFASVCPDVLEKAIADLSDGGAISEAARVFATAPMPELPGEETAAEPVAPVPAAPVAAAPAPAPEPAANPGNLALDKEGLPWDARIHATVEGGGGKITDKGVWRAKRGVTADAKAAVAAELKAALAAAPAPAAPVPPVPAAPVAAPPPPSAPASPVPPAEPAPSAPPAPAAPVAPAAPPAPAPAADAPAPAMLFAQIMGKVTSAQAAGKISAEEVTACLGGLGLGQLRDLLTRPDLIPAFEATVNAMIGE